MRILCLASASYCTVHFPWGYIKNNWRSWVFTFASLMSSNEYNAALYEYRAVLKWAQVLLFFEKLQLKPFKKLNFISRAGVVFNYLLLYFYLLFTFPNNRFLAYYYQSPVIYPHQDITYLQIIIVLGHKEIKCQFLSDSSPPVYSSSRHISYGLSRNKSL